MKKVMIKIHVFMGEYRVYVLCYLAACICAAVVSMLYRQPAEALLYFLILTAVLISAFLIRACLKNRAKQRQLQEMLEDAGARFGDLPSPDGESEKMYQQIIRYLLDSRENSRSSALYAKEEMLEFCTMWLHQMKIPIAAMQLLLNEEQPDVPAVRAELLKVSDYSEMIMSYLRLGSETTDYVFRRVSLDEIVRGEIRKYSRLFILKKIRLEFAETGRFVITDEKWLGFEIGQIISNALKYTKRGGKVRVSGEGENLRIEDDGIGILPENLPRIFEKGFTGHNGREDKKASGLGLWLCGQVAEKIGNSIDIRSEAGHGTCVILRIPDGTPVIE